MRQGEPRCREAVAPARPGEGARAPGLGRRAAPLAELVLAATVLALPPGPARANDSAAAVGAGGLTLTPDPDITLVSEDLRIAPDRIDVAYVFHNHAAAARTVTVAFPLPPIDGALALSPQSLPDEHQPNFVDFTVTVGEAEVRPGLEERAFLGEAEVGARLAALGLPLNPLRRADLMAGLARLTPAQRAGLVAEGLLRPEPDGATARWRSEAKFHWTQRFPPGEDLAVRHSYRPVRGLLLVDAGGVDDRTLRSAYCLDDAGAAAIRAGLARTAKAGGGEVLYGAVVPYILRTARNWSGPIGRFSLTVDKGRPDNLVSLCKGVVKTGPTTFAWTARDYRPGEDLAVLFLASSIGGLDRR